MSKCPHCGDDHGADTNFCPVTGEPIDLARRLMGQTLLDCFKVIEVIGEGSMGVVIEVVDIRSGRRYTAKQIHPRHKKYLDAVDHFFEEAQRAGKLGCKYIAKVVQVGRDSGATPTVIRESLNGQSLDSFLAENAPLPLNAAIKITRELLIALNAAHGAGLHNYYLSPTDIHLVHDEDEVIVKITDFGEHFIKKELKAENKKSLVYDDYLAPEQRRTGQKWDQRTDLFVVGIMLYQMVTGKIPDRLPAQANTLRTDLPTELNKLIHQALAFAPANRFQNAIDFLFALDKGASELMKEPVVLDIQVAKPDSVPPTSPEDAPADGTPTTSTPPEPVVELQSFPPQSYPPPASVPPADPSTAATAERNSVGADSEDDTTRINAESDEAARRPATAETVEQDEHREPEEHPLPLSNPTPTTPPVEESAEEQPVSVTPADPSPSEQKPVEEIKGTNPDIEQPSVIIEMTAMEKRFPVLYSKAFRSVIGVLVVLIALAGAAYYYWPQLSPHLTNRTTPEEAQPTNIIITVKTTPEKASVSIDGQRVEGIPARLNALRDNKFHTVLVKAAGFESIERDVKFDRDQEVTIALAEIVEADSADDGVVPHILDASIPLPPTPTAEDNTEATASAAEKPASNETPQIVPAAPETVPTTAEETTASAGEEVPSAAEKKRGVTGEWPKRKKQPSKSQKWQNKKTPKKPPKKQKSGKTRDGFSKDNPFD